VCCKTTVKYSHLTEYSLHAVYTVLVVVLGATYRGCDLLGEVAENMKAGIDNELTEGKKNKVGEWQTGDEVQKLSQTSLRRSLSLVLLSDLVTSMTVSDNEVSEKLVGHCAPDINQCVSAVSDCGSKLQSSVDIVDQKEHSFEVSNENCFVTDIPPLRQRLQLSQLQSGSAVTDSVSGRKLVGEELPLSDRRDELNNNFCLKKSSQRTVNSDSVLLPSRRCRALKLRTAILLSDVFLDPVRPSGTRTDQHKARNPDKALSENISDCGTSSTDVYQFDTLDSKLKESVSESDIIHQFQSSLHIVDKIADIESASGSESCFCEHDQIRNSSDEFIDADYCASTNAVASIDQSTTASSQQLSGPLIWSPRHCGNFCIETSIINTPGVDHSDSCENAEQVHTLSPCDVNNSKNGYRSLFDPLNTRDDIIAFSDEVHNNGDATSMSDLLFDDSVSLEEKLLVPVDTSEGYCSISVTENGNSHYENDYSVIVID